MGKAVELTPFAGVARASVPLPAGFRSRSNADSFLRYRRDNLLSGSMRPVVLAFLAAHMGALPQLRPAAAAQQPQTPPDSVRTDSIPTDSAHGSVHDPRMLLEMLGVFVVLPIAPPLIVTFAPPVDTSVKLTWLLKDHVAIRVAGGRSGEKGQSWTYAGDVELLRGPWYGEVRIENFHVPRHSQYQSISAGYLFRAKRGIAAGATLGYRHAPRDPTHSGVSLGLPYLSDLGRGVLRFEATYVFSSGGPSWNYRFHGEYPISDGPFSFGMSIEGKTYPIDGSAEGFTSAYGVLLAARL
jgi:hypothetical protein